MIGEMVDVAVPLIATKHAYVVTERIDGIAGMPNVRDHDSSIYFKLQGDALCVGGYENDPIFVDQVTYHSLGIMSHSLGNMSHSIRMIT